MSFKKYKQIECLLKKTISQIGIEGSIPRLAAHPLNSYESFKGYIETIQSEHEERERHERSLLTNTGAFPVEGFCYVCKKQVDFHADYSFSYERRDGISIPNWRESLRCPSCLLNNRMRASLHLFEQLLQPDKSSRIYITEQTTFFYKRLVGNYPNTIGSEYLGDHIPLGATDETGIRNEDVTHLSFPDAVFDFVLSFDVFEHISDVNTAFKECCRIIKKNGSLFFTVPFNFCSDKTVIRAVRNGNGQIEHLLPPEYHADPLNPEGCLVFRSFGWEMVNELRREGFADVNAHLYWAKEFGYLGREQAVFIATKR